jgi:glycogen debranching enzyme
MSEKLMETIEKTEKNYMENSLIHNYAQETWMDTISREGFCIENQAFYLNMLKLMQKFDNSQKWKKKEKDFRKNVKESFFENGILKDNLKEKEIRPNVFIAYYIYPELLNKKEWESVFDNLLESLWLEWGGISTIDKKSKDFHEYYTGENDFSYHQGDSWFWLNNLTAICLLKLNKKKYQKYIDKIKEASTEEILFRGLIGHASELSDAKELNPGGTFCQAWSSALFIELVNSS